MPEARRDIGPMFILAGVVLALGLVASFLWTQDTRRGGNGAPYSVERTDDQGAAVAYRMFRSVGLNPQVWNQEFTHLRQPGVMIMIAPEPSTKIMEYRVGTQGDLLPDELRALDAWVRQGNVAVVLSDDKNSLYDAVGLISEAPSGSHSLQPATPDQAGLLALGVSKLELQNSFGFTLGRKPPKEGEDAGEPPPVEMVPTDEWLTLFRGNDPGHTPRVVSASRGRGLYVAVCDTYPASNLGIAQGDNARFMLNLARLAPAGGTIWFDELHKRPVERGLMAYLREQSLLPFLVYLVVVLCFVFWRSGTRFGETVPLVPDRRRDAGEYIRAVAALYRNAGMPRDALAAVYADVARRLLGPASGSQAFSSDPRLLDAARRAEERTGLPAADVVDLFTQVERALARPSLTEADALACSARLSQLDRMLRRTPKAKAPGQVASS